MDVIYRYDALGYKFTGKERDTESNLDEFGARYYASSLSRGTDGTYPSFPKLRHKRKVILARIGRRFFGAPSFSRSEWTQNRPFELSHEFAAP